MSIKKDRLNNKSNLLRIYLLNICHMDIPTYNFDIKIQIGKKFSNPIIDGHFIDQNNSLKIAAPSKELNL